jgi:hypothetical protein
MNDVKEMTKCGRGIATVVVIVLLFGALLPLMSNTVKASEIESPKPAYGDRTTVYGTVKYANKNSDGTFENVPIDEQLSPLRFAKVEIRWAGREAIYGTTYTDVNGYFTFTFVPYDLDVNPKPVYARIYAESVYALVKDGSGVYMNVTDTVTVYTGTSVQLTFSTYPDHPAWNILDSVTETAEWVKARTGG